MLTNYIKIAWRNIARNKFASAINIGGLSVGMAVAMLIGLWIWSELSFNKEFPNYGRIAQVMQSQTFNGEVQTWTSVPMPLGTTLRNNFGSNFKSIVTSGWAAERMLSIGEKRIKTNGNYMEPGITEMLSLKMLSGRRSGLDEMNSILLSASAAKSFFGDADPVNRLMKLEDKSDVKVTGVYEDLPTNSTFAGLNFIAPFKLMVQNQNLESVLKNPWGASWFQIFAQVADNAELATVSNKIRNAKANSVDKQEAEKNKPSVFLQPMSRWHLYSEFKNGVNTGGAILYVWLFGIIGAFALLLACINFMNLSTARSEKRAREVGIRKAIGSRRGQLIYQFFTESILVALLAFIVSIVLLQLFIPFFNTIAGIRVVAPVTNPIFWITGFIFSVLTGLTAGTYPAIYLSSFNAMTVLKGAFRAGRFAAMPRKFLVVLQFSVSIILIVGTIVVFRQVEFARSRPVGYNRNNIVTVNADGIGEHFESFRNDLLLTGKVTACAESELQVTNTYITNSGFNWKGKDPHMQEEFVTLGITPEFGKTVDWHITEGRDFSTAFATDSMAVIINETAAKYLGMRNAVGEKLQWGKNETMHIIGIVKDMVTQNPYEPIKQTFFYLRKGPLSTANIRVNPRVAMSDAIALIRSVFKKYSLTKPFEYGFVDDEYAKKFSDELRVGKLAAFFAILAVFISCLGVFGMASFMAEQRTKEIGVRKILGATVLNVWQLLSKDFVLMVFASFLVAVPIAYYLMDTWLQNYHYRAKLSWWIFAAAGLGVLVITLSTVSFQSIKAALSNPVNSLRNE